MNSNKAATPRPSNLVLIGMPGAGKSTVGVILAKKTSRDFVDTDVLIQTSQQRSLQDIIDTDGYIALRRIEEEVLLGLSAHNHVIATGGSAAYSDPAMAQLKSDGLIVFLQVDLATLKSRVPDFSMRGLAKRPDQSFVELFEERAVLYARYADITMHRVAPAIEASIDIPLLHIADAMGEVLVQHGIRRVGLLGTAFTMEQDFYRGRLQEHGLSVLVPNKADREIVHRTIYQELCLGKIISKSKVQYLRIIDELAEQGAEAVILGCTEIGMLVTQDDTNISLFDTTAVHAAKAVEFALS